MGSIYNKNYIKYTYDQKKSSYPSKFCRYLFSKFTKGSSILDVGCGNGDISRELLEMGFDVQALDIADNTLPPERFNKVDLQKGSYPFPDNSFDIIFCKSVLEHLREPDCLIDEAYRILKPGGTFICLVPSWKHSYQEQFYIDHTHCTPFTRYSLEMICKMSGFKAECEYFYQLPILWKYPFLHIFRALLNFLRLPYRPFDKVPWGDKLNKTIRFSREAMLFCICKKEQK